MSKSKIFVTAPGASENELLQRAAAAVAVFARLDVDPQAAARAHLLVERWDEGFIDDAPPPSDYEFDLAAVWVEATGAALTASRLGWTSPPPGSGIGLFFGEENVDG